MYITIINELGMVYVSYTSCYATSSKEFMILSNLSDLPYSFVTMM